MKPLFITGIGTDIGKTIVSAILTEKFRADYWKPIQAGDLDQSDTIKVRNLVSNQTSVFHPETYRLTHPFSPHKAADLDRIEIELSKIIIPATENTLIIEGAGGLMVPLNDKELVIDLISHLDAEALIVSKNYLGSINHTLLTIDALKNRNIPIKGIIFNGDSDSYSEELILEYSGLKLIARVPQLLQPAKHTISELDLDLSGLI